MPEETPEKGGLSSLQDALKTTFFFIRITMFLLVIGFIFSGVESIDKNEKALVLQFGKLKSTSNNNSSFVFAWPYPFDSVIKIKTSSSRSIKSNTFSPEINEADKIIQTTPNKALIPGKDGYLLTADMNILHCESTLRYTIQDLPKYLFDNEQLEILLHQVLDNALLQTVSARNIKQARQQKELRQSTQSLVNKRISDMQLGIEILSLELKTSFPLQMRKEANALSLASNQASKLINEAETYASKTVDEAESESANIISRADIDTTSLKARSDALLKTFLSLKGLYDKAPQMTRELLLREKMADILPDLEAVYFTDPENTELRLSLPRRPLQKKGELKK
ncbi:protease modulator HflK [Lentisphaera profundi]|uniref:Protease modulator HflK n=1 Tax=Lentisphaera profundi TaxID=1658616 RepID=A0ABY7VP65_9BACT|nr:protease modulator HflK [Lentisphaera profundi]WDE95945.1 protease modulator HflK [Lentisphaera profundi]